MEKTKLKTASELNLVEKLKNKRTKTEGDIKIVEARASMNEQVEMSLKALENSFAKTYIQS